MHWHYPHKNPSLPDNNQYSLRKQFNKSSLNKMKNKKKKINRNNNNNKINKKLKNASKCPSI